MFEVVRYAAEQAGLWNAFVAKSKNATFLFDRNYMDYHADRFTDHSLMIYRRGRLFALLPANERDGGVLESHGGLTYGGLVMSRDCTGADVEQAMRCICDYLRSSGFNRVLYKPTPWIYHRQPSEEDLYALFAVCEARLVARGLSSVICRDDRNEWFRIRLMGRRRAQEAGITIQKTDHLEPFWQILTTNLKEKYNLLPVHTVEEMQLLQSRFPENIRLITAVKDGQTLGGTVLYVTPTVVHSQYIAASPEGKRLHALDLLFGEVIEQALQQHPYFDFGISTERDGEYLNAQLAYQKEGFGGRGLCYDHYEWTLS